MSRTNRLATVVIQGESPRRVNAIAEILREIGCEVTPCETAEAVLKEAGVDVPDLLVVAPDWDSAGHATAPCSTGKLSDSVRIPVVFWGAEEEPRLFAEAMRHRADDVLTDDWQADEVVWPLRRLMRLSTQLAEVRRRFRLADQFGSHLPNRLDLAADTAPHRVLVVPLDSGPATEIPPLPADEAAVSICTDVYAVSETLSKSEFDVVLLTAGTRQAAETALETCQRIRNNPFLFNLPLIVAPARIEGMPTRRHFLDHGASQIVELPAGDEKLRCMIGAQGERQRLRRQIRDSIVATLDGPTQDDDTGSYRLTFLSAHLEALTAEMRRVPRHLTVGYFGVASDVESIRRDLGAEAAGELVRQVCAWITGLVRLEDMVAHVGNGEFCVALPDTPTAEAEIVKNRITGVLNSTDLALPDVHRPIRIAMRAGVGHVEPGDDAAALIARARNAYAQALTAG